MEKLKSVFAWLGAALLAVGGIVVGILFMRRSNPSELETASNDAQTRGEKAVADATAKADAQATAIEAQHHAEKQALAETTSDRAAALERDPAALAAELKRHARS